MMYPYRQIGNLYNEDIQLLDVTDLPVQTTCTQRVMTPSFEVRFIMFFFSVLYTGIIVCTGFCSLSLQ